jgi:NADH:ubiquinone oxidoreductase subunit 2 (subunit N)
MVVNSVVSLYYYLAVPKQMLVVEAEHERPIVAPALVTAVAVLATVAVVAVGVWPELLAHFPPLSTLVGQ